MSESTTGIDHKDPMWILYLQSNSLAKAFDQIIEAKRCLNTLASYYGRLAQKKVPDNPDYAEDIRKAFLFEISKQLDEATDIALKQEDGPMISSLRTDYAEEMIKMSYEAAIHDCRLWLD